MESTPPIAIFVVGTTGVGKSQLALDIALKFNGEIVNADSMQVYGGNLEGAMTARPSCLDLEKVPHHLYGVIDMLETVNYNVQKYLKQALETIASIFQRGKTPVVVGGTNYYIEALLFKNQKEQELEDVPDNEADNWVSFNERMTSIRHSIPESLLSLFDAFTEKIPIDDKQAIEDNFEGPPCHQLLSLTDPKMAEFLHANDKRKIVNALFKAFKNQGALKQSDINSGKTGLPLRFLPILLWMKADKEVLLERVTKRVDQMIDNDGGITEIMHVFNKTSPNFHFDKGILQSIGYKEFYSYYQAVQQNNPDLDSVLTDCKSKLVSATMKYANYQVKWLNKRIWSIFGGRAEQDLIIKIELNDKKQYEEVAKTRGFEFVHKQMLRYSYLSDPVTFLDQYCNHYLDAKADKMANWKKQFCECCSLEINGQIEWDKHIKTRRHKGLKAKQKRIETGEQARIEEYKNAHK